MSTRDDVMSRDIPDLMTRLTRTDIKVRPVDGLHGIDFLSEDMLVRDATSVFSHLIAHLSTLGYDNKSLYAATVRYVTVS